MKVPIPYPCLDDNEETSRIQSLAKYVARNGNAFEEKVKQKEENNPLFTFLFSNLNEKGYNYYQWSLFCAKNNYSTQQVAEVEEGHCQRLKQTKSGYINLTLEDVDVLTSMLFNNSGGKDAIKRIRKWIVERAHSFVAIIIEIYLFIKNLYSNHDSNQKLKILYAIYVINDLLFNSSSATTMGPYTRFLKDIESVDIFSCILPFLPGIMQLAYKSFDSHSDKEKLLKINNLWTSKQFVEKENGEKILQLFLQEKIVDLSDILDRTKKSLVSPYIAHLYKETNVMNELEEPDLYVQYNQAAATIQTTIARTAYPLEGAAGNNHQVGDFGQSLPSAPVSVRQLDLPPRSGMPPLPPRPPHSVAPPLVAHSLLPSIQQLQQQQQQQLQLQLQLHTSQPMIQPPPALLNLYLTTVGTLVNIFKTALKTGHPRYAPLDPSSLTQAVPPFIEQGRLDARVSEFYRKYQTSCPSNSSPPSMQSYSKQHEQEQPTSSTVSSSHAQHHMNASLHHVLSPKREAYKTDHFSYNDRDIDDDRNRKRIRSNHLPLSNASVYETENNMKRIDQDNVGHQLQKGYGVQECRGVWAEGAGRVEVFSATGNSSRVGIAADTGKDFHGYRQQLSSSYHIKISDREKRFQK